MSQLQGRPARVMLPLGTSHRNNCLNCSDMTYFAAICSTKNYSELELSEVSIAHITNRGKAGMMLHIGASHSNS